MSGQQAAPRFNGSNVPIPVVAKALRKDAQFVRVGLQRGLLPFGVAYKVDDSNTQYDYYVSPLKLWEYSGFIYEKSLDNSEGTGNNDRP